MNKRFPLTLKRLLSPSLVLLAALAVFAPGAAQATPYVVKLTQQGSNVVATGSGEFDLTGLSMAGPGGGGAGVFPSIGTILVGPAGSHLADLYIGFTGPTSFGSGSGAFASSGSGDVALINGSSNVLGVPSGYTSGSPLADSSTYDGQTFASLGVTPGTYVWTWGSAADQSFTIMIGNAVGVPEPAALGMFGLGVLLLGGFAMLRRRGQRQA